MKEHVAELRRLESAIDAFMADSEDTREEAAALVAEHQKRLESLFADLGSQKPEGELLAFLQATQAKLTEWTKQAEREREETRKQLLNLAQGRKAKRQY
ncbi:MAG: hypothetical protein JJU10_08025 [Idiomarina sp.]|nr:hypothetical protein [Idiomarina sp.]